MWTLPINETAELTQRSLLLIHYSEVLSTKVKKSFIFNKLFLLCRRFFHSQHTLPLSVYTRNCQTWKFFFLWNYPAENSFQNLLQVWQHVWKERLSLSFFPSFFRSSNPFSVTPSLFLLFFLLSPHFPLSFKKICFNSLTLQFYFFSLCSTSVIFLFTAGS